MADKVLVKYEADISQFDQQLDRAEDRLRSTEAVGKKAFDGVEKGASAAGKSIDVLAGKAQSAAPKFNALQGSINQLSREMPAFAVNVNTGFLAISNNIPALVDSINQIKTANAALKAEGKATESVLSQVAKGLFSWNTALSVGITLLTVFGGKIIDYITGQGKSTKATEEAAKAQEEENKKKREYLDLLNLINPNRLKEWDAINKVNAARKGGLNDLNRELALLKARGADITETFGKEQKIRELEILAMKQTQATLELTGDDKLILGQKILDKENEMKASQLAYEKEINDRRLEEERKYAEEQEKIRKQKEKHLKEQADIEQRIADDADEYERDRLRKQKKREQDKTKQDRKDLDELNKKEKQRLEDRIIMEGENLNRRREIIDEEYEKGLIRQAEYAAASKEIDDMQMQQKWDLVANIASIFGSLAALAGQQTEAGKAFAVAETTIQTYAAAQKAYSSQIIPGDPTSIFRATIAAAAAVASGLARVTQILKVDVPAASVSTPNAQPKQSTTAPSTYPRFKDGVVDLMGPGTGTSDSIPAYLSRGESVITAKSTRAKRDELEALNKSVIDYDALIMKKYVDPALRGERMKAQSMAENMAQAIGNNFSDKRIVKAIENSRPATAKDIERLTNEVAKSNRLAKFENQLRGK